MNLQKGPVQFHTAALRDLCTEEQLDLLISIDTLRSQGISHYISLPQLIVCGRSGALERSAVFSMLSRPFHPVRSTVRPPSSQRRVC